MRLLILFTLLSAPFGTFSEGLLGDIVPQGWIREYLERQCSGLSGHPEAMSYPYDSCLWGGQLERMSTHGSGWWRYEQTAYYSDGLLRLGYALDRKDFIDKIEEDIAYTLANATPEGLLGSGIIHREKNCFMWPQAVFFRALQAYYDKTGDERIPKALEKYYLNYSAEQISMGRNIVSIEGMLWTYGRTGNRALLDLAEKAYALGDFELYPEMAGMDGCPHIHGVTFCEEMKLPEILYAWTGKAEYKKIADSFHDKLVGFNMLPDGVPTSVEHVCGNNIKDGHETCDIADFSWTEGYYLMTTGEARYADSIEKAAFNAAPGAVTKDFKAIQYFSNVNQFIVTGTSDPNAYRKGMTWQAYRPVHETECCIGNVHRIMPNYVSRMWLKDADGGLVAALYGPSEIRFGNLRVEERTVYPFDEDILFVFHCDKAVKTSFTFRIPGWCRSAKVSFNGKDAGLKLVRGGFVTLKKAFREGDELLVHLDMPVRMNSANGQGLCWERGPLLFSYPIPERKEEDLNEYERMRGKKSGNPDFKCWNFFPAGPFNYAIFEAVPKLVRNDVPEGSYPFENPPYSIRIPVREIEWDLVEGRYTPELPPFSVKKLQTRAWIDLIPYGCTQLRLTVFPQLSGKVKNEGLF